MRILNGLNFLLKSSESKKRIIEQQVKLSSQTNSNASILFWTTHKCASTFMSKCLPLLAKASNKRYFDYATDIWNLGNKIKLKEPFVLETQQDLYKPYGEIYGPLRTPFELDSLNLFRNIFFLRDPRDLLISNYFSQAFSHEIPRHKNQAERFFLVRESALKLGLDRYCISEAKKWTLNHFLKYKYFRENSKSSYYIKYDDFFYSFDNFTDQLLEAFGIESNTNISNRLSKLDGNKFKVKRSNLSENIYSQTRNGTSGQFREKLKNTTINELNQILLPVLNYWNFEL